MEKIDALHVGDSKKQDNLEQLQVCEQRRQDEGLGVQSLAEELARGREDARAFLGAAGQAHQRQPVGRAVAVHRLETENSKGSSANDNANSDGVQQLGQDVTTI